MTFWDHLDVLRKDLVRVFAAILICGTAAFFFKDEIFAIILAPKEGNFILYRIFGYLSGLFASGSTGSETANYSMQLINTSLASQFTIHIRISLYVGVLVSSPYIIYRLFSFISPGLYENERRYTVRVVIWGYFLFMTGVMMCYFLIFPLTIRFLGTYQVSSEVENMITLQSYIGTLTSMSLMLGILFELPAVAWLLGKLGIITSAFMRRFRKQVIIAICVISAIITPTGDAFTLLVVAIPIWALYEASILIVQRTSREKA